MPALRAAAIWVSSSSSTASGCALARSAGTVDHMKPSSSIRPEALEVVDMGRHLILTDSEVRVRCRPRSKPGRRAAIAATSGNQGQGAIREPEVTNPAPANSSIAVTEPSVTPMSSMWGMSWARMDVLPLTRASPRPVAARRSPCHRRPRPG